MPSTGGRAAFDRRAWAEAHAQLAAADQQGTLAPEDLERLATVSYLVGRDDDAAEIWERAYGEAANRADHAGAARCAFWLAHGFLNRGEVAHGTGWLAKARRQLDQTRRECAEQGYLSLLGAIQQTIPSDHAAAASAADAAAALGERCGDPDLVIFARSVRGRALVRQGKVGEGMALHDDVMVAVLADEVSPALAGDSTVSGPTRARRPHRRTSSSSGRPSHPATGAACYVLAELHRLSGEFSKADAAYREASRWGREPHPGLARLRLAQGQVDTALAAIRRALSEGGDRATRASLLAAAVDILLAAGDVPAARASAAELAAIAAVLDAPVMRAMTAHANGAVLCTDSDARAALVELRRAWKLWHELAAPYEAARVRSRRRSPA